jgi:putative pyruvate formate lyase activating enzyme
MIGNYSCCELCPRRCRVDRSISRGFCGQGIEPIIARASLHMWEEPCISGKEGSGTLFFVGCTLGCVYCQNAEISRQNKLDTLSRDNTVSAERLADIFLKLRSKGANNINLVTPTMFSPHIIEAIRISRLHGLNIPIVYNTSGYELAEIIESLSGSVDIYMPDFKYLSHELSAKYSSAADYPEFAKSSLRMMVQTAGGCEFNQRGMMTRGVIVRHLLLPGKLAESKRVIEYLFMEYGNDIYYSLMSQYTPVAALNKEKYPELSRRVTTYEYNKLIDYALSLGMTDAFIQEGGAAKESFIPSFNGEGV